jgi:broad specificity phosphatase PhoE
MFRVPAFAEVAVVDLDLVEWDYGCYEGKLTQDIPKERPDGDMFRDGCPGGESPLAAGAGPLASSRQYATATALSWRSPVRS